MPRRPREWEDDDADWDAEADADADEDGDDDDEPTVACPHCRRQIHEDSQRCPYCEQYISEEDQPTSPKRWWIILGAILGLLSIYSWFAR